MHSFIKEDTVSITKTSKLRLRTGPHGHGPKKQNTKNENTTQSE